MKKIIFLHFMYLMLGVVWVNAQSVSINIPTDVTGEPGEMVLIPINVADLSNYNVISYQIAVTYDSTILSADSVTTSGTISENLTVFSNISSGRIVLGSFSPFPISGSGTLVFIIFAVNSNATSGQTSLLVFENFLFNSGNPSADSDNGLFTVVGASSAIDLRHPVIPEKPALFQNYPNPFNQTTVIMYELNRTVPIQLGIFDITGRLVRVLRNGVKAGGRHVLYWDGRDGLGREAASGIYIVRLKTDDFSTQRKIVLRR